MSKMLLAMEICSYRASNLEPEESHKERRSSSPTPIPGGSRDLLQSSGCTRRVQHHQTEPQKRPKKILTATLARPRRPIDRRGHPIWRSSVPPLEQRLRLCPRGPRPRMRPPRMPPTRSLASHAARRCSNSPRCFSSSAVTRGGSALAPRGFFSATALASPMTAFFLSNRIFDRSTCLESLVSKATARDTRIAPISTTTSPASSTPNTSSHTVGESTPAAAELAPHRRRQLARKQQQQQDEEE
jgi:hypothetical protein